ncbi:hypothetical protein [Fibrella arboris]|uniref:hypothetical protein n=1 Tax=Fibrella arboris TaxID=3242486 RepID=UPI0035210A19
MEIVVLVLLVLAALAGLLYAGNLWASQRTAVRSDLVELDRQEDLYRFGMLGRVGRRVKAIKAKWLNRGRSQHKPSNS